MQDFPQDPATRATTRDRMALLGEIAWLAMQAAPHRDWPLAEIGRAFMPPAGLGQLRLWRRGDRPVGMAVWAWLDQAREAAFLAGDWAPGPDDWRCGPRPVVTNLIAPFGDGARLALDLRRVAFPGLVVRALRVDAEGRPRRAVTYPAWRPASPVRQRTAGAAVEA